MNYALRLDRRFTFRGMGIALAAMLVGALACVAGAQPAPDAADAAPPAKVGVASAGSLANLAEFTKSISVDTPPFFTAHGIEQMFPFIGDGGFDDQRPVGVVFFSGSGIAWLHDGDGIVMMLPVKRGAAPIKSLIDQGATPIAGRTDAVLFQGTVILRTADYLAMGSSQPAVLAVTDTDLTDQYKAGATGASALASVSIDFAAMRKSDPQGWTDTFTSGRGGHLNDAPIKAVAEQMFGTVDRLALSMSVDQSKVRLQVAMTPVKGPAAGDFKQAGLPEDIFVRGDLQALALQQLTALVRVGEAGAEHGFDQNPQGAALAKKFIEHLGHLLLGGNATSFGIAPAGNGVVVYVVEHRDAPVDVKAELTSLSDEFNATNQASAHEGDKNTTTEIQKSTSAGGMQFARLIMRDRGETQVIVDAAARGNDVLLVLGDQAAQSVDAIKDLPAGQAIEGLGAVSVDLTKLYKEMTSQKALPPITADDDKKLSDALVGQQLTLRIAQDGDGISATLEAPRALVKLMGEMVSRPAPTEIQIAPPMPPAPGQ